jgi:hypothetical protein
MKNYSNQSIAVVAVLLISSGVLRKQKISVRQFK